MTPPHPTKPAKLTTPPVQPKPSKRADDNPNHDAPHHEPNETTPSHIQLPTDERIAATPVMAVGGDVQTLENSDFNPNDRRRLHDETLASDDDFDKDRAEDEAEDELDFHGDDSYIYGDDYDEDTPEDTTPDEHLSPAYNPDAQIDEDRFTGKNELVNCYAYSRKSGENIGEIELEDVRRELANNNIFVWVGLHDPSVETIREVQEAFDLHELAIEDAFAEHQRAKVESYGNDSVFVVVRTAKLSDNTIRYGTTAIFMGKQYIITIRQGASHSYQSVRDYCHRRPEKLRLGPIFVLHAILDFIVDNYLPITEKLGRYLREQEREIFSQDFDKQTLRNLYELKSQLVHMRAVILPVQDICNFFLNHKKTDLIPNFPSQAKPYFRDVNDHLLRALDAVNGLNEMLSVAMDTYMAVVTMGQNEVVRKLAAWAGILAVPTALAGIYGMNFDNMPELHWQYGYFLLVATILIICLTLYYRFRKAGWL